MVRKYRLFAYTWLAPFLGVYYSRPLVIVIPAAYTYRVIYSSCCVILTVTFFFFFFFNHVLLDACLLVIYKKEVPTLSLCRLYTVYKHITRCTSTRSYAIDIFTGSLCSLVLRLLFVNSFLENHQKAIPEAIYGGTLATCTYMVVYPPSEGFAAPSIWS